MQLKAKGESFWTISSFISSSNKVYKLELSK